MTFRQNINKVALFVKDFQVIITGLAVLGALVLTGYGYLAPMSLVKELECGLESQRLLAIQRDDEISNFRDRITAQDRERMLTDLSILIVEDSMDSEDLQRFKKALKEHIKSRIEVVRSETTKLGIEAAALKKQVIELENKVAKRMCPDA